MLFLVACGNETYYIEPEILPYVQEFNQDSPIDASQIEIIFMELDHNDGLCYTKNKRIYIDKRKWGMKNYVQKKVLIYHELGHCILNLEHNNMKNNFCPESIMHPYCVSYSRCYEDKWDDYLEELFY